ncbi:MULTISPECIES: glutaredoxin 3 [unclassified Arsukibacterium]|uniref:glutaredoxin 3 n=1 Tax=unclassified Arsukibacterium TaxID=2635278 RepID=UPI000C504282|nr:MULTISPECIES: glutaredoxin 3 [unclassified Arsukibacterium]MAA93268.1 glutaredoxin 3 [Rheinheimera sp.]MBM34240.1 glutaredoxin 3 [Rheinheimera sp.]HAW92239.1 glutaredoxin 3 [Candidatus Azambacteria bacterium]|tara:strand:- start:52954 stop:53211 length:258 start_codon:yes stop_codon:yes gene_type:complete
MAEVIIYTKAYCPYCVRAKSLLDEKQVAYHEVKIDEQPERRVEMIEKAGGRSTVPQIFIGTTHIGGCDEMFALHAAGKLEPLLNA